MPSSMAAVLALIMLPIVASLGFFFGVLRGDDSPAAACAGAVFFALAAFVLGNALRLVRDAEKTSR